MAHRAIHSKFGTGVIITGGLGGHAQHSLIAKRYAMYIPNIDIAIDPPVADDRAGGATASTTQRTDYTSFRVTIITKNKKHERVFHMPAKRANVVVNVLNLINETKRRLGIRIDGLRRVATRIQINIDKIRKRDK
jgi:hypothetical protein